MALPIAGLVLVLTAAGCTPRTDTALLDAYLEPQPPVWRGLPEPTPIPPLSQDTRLVGMATDDLRAVFGDPSLVRTEGNVQYWRYSFVGCILELFVEKHSSTGASKVLFFDLRPNSGYGNGGAVRDCEFLAENLRAVDRATPEGALPPVESF